jgi:hypothetical protein
MIKSNQFPVKAKVIKQYCLYWIVGNVKKAITNSLPYAILQSKKKEFEKQIQYKSGLIKILPV